MGIWTVFKEAIFDLLHWLELFTGDWGLAIIALTILLRLVLWPLTDKQTRSAHETRKHTPKIKEIQTKYADNPEKKQEELMKYYSEHKVNPLAGCLPMLLQMPIFIALYQVLGGTPDKPGLMTQFLADTGATGSFWRIIPDLTLSPSAVFGANGVLSAIPYVILVVLFGLSIWLPQQLMATDKQQKMIGLYMAVFMLIVGWSVPAGVLLYWDTSALLGVAQQQYLQHKLNKADEAEEAAAAAEKAKKKAKKKQS